MEPNTILHEVNDRQIRQPFQQFDGLNSKERSLDEFCLLPNQFAYKVDCSTTEVISTKGNLNQLTGIKQLASLEDLQNRIKSSLTEKYREETLSIFNFCLGNGDRMIPLRNTFSSIIEIEKAKAKNVTVYRQLFALKSDRNGIMTHSGAICTVIDGIKASARAFDQHQCTGKDSIYYRAEELLNFKYIFSVRELQLLKLISKGYRTNSIANQLFISPKTVETHRKNMLKKLEAKTTPHMVALAKDMGLL